MSSVHNRVLDIIKKNHNDSNNLHSILYDIKTEFNYFSNEIITTLSKNLSIPRANIEGVLTFYSFLGSEPCGKYTIRLCRTISCELKGRGRILKKIQELTGAKLDSTSPDGLFTIKECNCLGMCDQGPAILVNSTLLSKIDAESIEEIIESCRCNSFNQKYSHRYLSTIHSTGPLFDFLNSSKNSFKEYVNSTPEEIIEKITAAGLRGRGGAGFPTGVKWSTAYNQTSDQKYIICNADEGEPGTFKDRYILDNYPDRVIEGMIIGAKAIGASKGIIYLRGEYAYLLDKIEKTISNYDADITVHLGSGSYVCGEETALIESLEGKRGEARNRPPYPVEVGYLGKPTVVNNVETFVNVTYIMEYGSKDFIQWGTKESNGTKFFSISGDLEQPGIYELPFGITIKELIDLLGAQEIKSVQLGGASGINIGIKDFDKKIAFEAVPSGGAITLFNRERNMLEVAKNFMEFFVDESCGQCVPCREGTTKLLEGIETILAGNCSMEYLDRLTTLGNAIMLSSKCGLGQVCAKGFLSILENHRDEVLNYIKEQS